jgi:hypothetical protein
MKYDKFFSNKIKLPFAMLAEFFKILINNIWHR